MSRPRISGIPTAKQQKKRDSAFDKMLERYRKHKAAPPQLSQQEAVILKTGENK